MQISLADLTGRSHWHSHWQLGQVWARHPATAGWLPRAR